MDTMLGLSIPGLGMIDMTAPDRTPDFELWCVECAGEARFPMWWDAGDAAWYCGTHGWRDNPCGQTLVNRNRKGKFPHWMPFQEGLPEEER